MTQIEGDVYEEPIYHLEPAFALGDKDFLSREMTLLYNIHRACEISPISQVMVTRYESMREWVRRNDSH